MRALRPGDRLCLFSPSSEIASFTERLSAGVVALGQLGFETAFSNGACARRGGVAGDPRTRARDIIDAVVDPNIAGLIATTGGYSSLSVLPWIDYGAVEANPKPLIGFSDVSALLLAVYSRCRQLVFHGPMLLSSWGENGGPFAETTESFRACVMTPGASVLEIGEFPLSTSQSVDWRSMDIRRQLSVPEWRARTLRGGVAEGRLICANLDTLIRLLPTPYMPSLRGCILAVEEAAGSVPATERDLACLRLSGALRGIVGFVYGKPFTYVDDPDYLLETMLADFASDLGVPAVFGLDIGHSGPMHTLPIGAAARLDASALRLQCFLNMD